jgi:UDP-N-acetylmuramoyl-L-alanyl-D-glutamate--2,6-diaminopimelate ligase
VNVTLGALLPILCPTEAGWTRYAPLADLEVRDIVNDSRQVRPGSVFVALRGATTDGHSFIPNALRAGAIAVVSERRVSLPDDTVHFLLPDARRRLGALAAAVHGDPTRSLHVTGITGTNGKTTTSYRTRAVLEAAGHPTGLVGTIAYRIGQRTIPAGNTTPDSLVLQDFFAQMRDAGTTHAVIEVSSHALDMHRVAHVDFDVAVFTCLSDREHLDYHGTFEHYRDAKARLFEMLSDGATAVLNADDPLGSHMADRTPDACRRLWFGLNGPADVTAEVRSMTMDGTIYRLHTPAGTAEVRSILVGEFNLRNDLAAAATACAADVGLDAIVAGLERDEPVPGRLERIPGSDFYPLVDYAHNEGALDSVLETLRGLAPRRLLVVFGCGGDRDRSKRPAMGAVSEKYCDHIVLTADNSRSEDTLRIIREIELGMTGRTPHEVEPDREQAIRAAVAAAEPGDVLLVAGKGHETYQILGPVKAPFDDREVLRRAVAEREAGRTHAVRAET